MKRRLHIGISPCPNDTFAFHGLLARTVEVEGHAVEIELADVQELNERLAQGDFDAAKASFATALTLADRTLVLPAGAALGFGVGPLLLRATRRDRASVADRTQDASPRRVERDARVVCPGAGTTAHLLYRLFHPGEGQVEQVVFSQVFAALESGAADYGVCIHEGRFTYEANGLELVEDLGATWERLTRGPLPLGGILARRELPHATRDLLTHAIQRSLDDARANRTAALATMRRHAQEQDDAVLWAHVDLYVNAATRELGVEGRRALAKLAELARVRGLVADGCALEVHAPRASLQSG